MRTILFFIGFAVSLCFLDAGIEQANGQGTKYRPVPKKKSRKSQSRRKPKTNKSKPQKQYGKFSKNASQHRGWTKPRNKSERQALREALAGHGRAIMTHHKINDPRFQARGWEKWAVKVREPHRMTIKSKQLRPPAIQVHYMRNTITGERVGFKFKQGERKAGSRKR
ncbi:hypothetical protein MFFC18_08930 [Mariniblastus fucicola]|uniref:Uncharacterized protein n=1 Tax=Mariniblastus fucicola TaxID=980251 RepID=A0A5B9PDA4_9BACT|nr:hypothetical protein MFFC18_08930 [Mariniblastus fucicola]